MGEETEVPGLPNLKGEPVADTWPKNQALKKRLLGAAVVNGGRLGHLSESCQNSAQRDNLDCRLTTEQIDGAHYEMSGVFAVLGLPKPRSGSHVADIVLPCDSQSDS